MSFPECPGCGKNVDPVLDERKVDILQTDNGVSITTNCGCGDRVTLWFEVYAADGG